jgi:Na+-transporting methylmalonyl-CoA/oxaloacetate decarboxylase gamma subunit
MTADGRPFTLASRALQVGLLGLAGYGVAIGAVGLAVNAVLSLAVTFIPPLLEWRYDHEVDPRLSLWIAVAASVHAAGFLGPYDAQSGLLAWYDQVAHMISGGLVAGVGYALVEALDRESDRVEFPEGFRFVFVIVFILAFGVLWEIGEFAGGFVGKAVSSQEILIQYGIEDIVADLVFNTIAAVAVALWGTGYFDDIAAIFTGRLSDSENR